MTVYVVTQSAGYYPLDAAGDWLSVHDDEQDARAAFDAVKVESWASTALIAVTPPTWNVLAEK